jgi:signal transduction histidine kinase
VVLAAEENESQITLSVYNEGAGIHPEKMAVLFEKFRRLDGAEYTGKKGTGLGLYICREIVEKQGGKIWAESQEERLVRFIFTVPKQVTCHQLDQKSHKELENEQKHTHPDCG